MYNIERDHRDQTNHACYVCVRASLLSIEINFNFIFIAYTLRFKTYTLSNLSQNSF